MVHCVSSMLRFTQVMHVRLCLVSSSCFLQSIIIFAQYGIKFFTAVLRDFAAVTSTFSNSEVVTFRNFV